MSTRGASSPGRGSRVARASPARPGVEAAVMFHDKFIAFPVITQGPAQGMVSVLMHHACRGYLRNSHSVIMCVQSGGYCLRPFIEMATH